MPVARRLTAEGPRPPQGWDQQETAFVDEDEMGPQVLGPFFIRGHSSRFQRAIPASSRSSARRSGFWQLKPRPWSNRPNMVSMVLDTEAAVNDLGD